jgi:hypothetical protein
MPICMGIKADHTACTRNANLTIDPIPAHLHFCNQHTTVYNRRVANAAHHVEGNCLHFVNGHRRGWCHHAAEAGTTICMLHRQVREAAVARRQANTQRELEIETTIAVLLARDPVPIWQEVVHILVQHPDTRLAYTAAQRYYLHPTVRALDAPAWRELHHLWRFTVYWDWARHGVGEPPNVDAAPQMPVVARPLERLAGDAQNVHTTVVSQQTNAGMQKLLNTIVPKEQQTEKTIVTAWITHIRTANWSTILKTVLDVNQWFNTKTCRETNDCLYFKLLRGLVASINRTEDEMKTELYKRLWEECKEATGMCCEGHISRLCNVLVGFDDAFQPPVALGELIQQKMAAIAGLDVDEEEKRRQANAWFDEVALPTAERVAWLEAF